MASFDVDSCLHKQTVSGQKQTTSSDLKQTTNLKMLSLTMKQTFNLMNITIAKLMD